MGRNTKRGGIKQWVRSYHNKLDRVNRDRVKSGKPKLGALDGYNPVTGIPDSR